ncbi:head-tail adaptor protein [Phaeobacter sp. NW0010-22]|uniref:head-tail adaptor protein n=1 Tax=Phaeobacter sp. NW0010-22 TaxID=3135907 RepID=UPI003103AB01
MRFRRLRDHVAFDRPAQNPDGSGGAVDGWAEQYTCKAEFIYSRGSETVDAARLQGRSIYKVKIRQSPSARSITSDFRMRDLNRDTEYNLREVDAITDKDWVYIVAESGVAV